MMLTPCQSTCCSPSNMIVRSRRVARAQEWLKRKTSDARYVKYEAENLADFEEYLMAQEAERQRV